MTASKILVVEDEGLVGLELADALARMGYDVLPVVPSGREAIEQAAREKPDLVLMDIRLEGELDGIETAKRIRERHGIPVIYLTAHSDEATLQRAKLTEAFGYLLKPFEHRTLRAAVETALFKAQREREREDGFDWDESIGEHLADGLVVMDTAGVIRFVNRAAARIAGREREACRGASFPDVFPATDAVTREEAVIPLSSVAVEDRTIVSDRLLRIGPAGRETLAEYVMKPAKNRCHATIGIICLLREVHEKDRNGSRVRFELEQSRRYQLGLLPERGRAVRGVVPDWLFHPSVYGSGDIFNLFALDDRRVGFYLLDVMGHGFQSAVLAVTIYSFLSYDVARLGILRRSAPAPVPDGEENVPALSEEGEVPADAPPGAGGRVLSPSEVIAELNRRFYLGANDNPFFTLVYGVIDTAAHRGVLARAGHHFPLLGDKTGRLERIAGGGQAIGMFPEIEVEEKEFDFGPGARLYLYSDGLLEAIYPGGGEAAEKKLESYLRENAGAALAGIRYGLDDLVSGVQASTMFEDDVTFFALERE